MRHSGWLLKFGIGGVQASIAQSRRLRDLAEGSKFIVSAVNAAAVKAQELGAVIVTPAGAADGNPCGNHLVVEWREAKKAVSELAAEMATSARSTWVMPGAGVGRDGQSQADRVALEHLEQAMELWWVATPLPADDPRAWAEAYNTLALLALDRRWTRSFSQLTPLPGGAATCLQCGVRPRLQRASVAAAKAYLSEDEEPCAVCLTRRVASFGSQQDATPSTVLIARAPFQYHQGFARHRAAFEQSQVSDPALKQILSELISHTVETDEPQVARKLVELARQSHPDSPAEIDRAVRAITALPPYYAVVMFDGDRIGEWFSGGLSNAGRVDLRSWQQSLSGALGEFAKRVRKDLCFPPAKLVYAGGDDGLVFTSLDGLLSLMARLHAWWHEAMESLPGNERPTLSLHASVVHVKEPLQAVLARGRQDLERAKDVADRDCLSLLVDPRGGAPSSFAAKWSELELIRDALDWFQQSASGRVGHTLLERSAAFFDTRIGANGLPVLQSNDAWLRELDLCVSRSERGPGSEAWSRVRGWMSHRVSAAWLQDTSDGVPRPTPWQSVADGLQVVLFLARQLKAIEGAAKGGTP
ncbi:MAG: hypothetical protein IPK72_21635 [Candidatus Eisenbacteria bacterium]|nr:hypothetical protein [Candidatus Eisenbacteria bacterium]